MGAPPGKQSKSDQYDANDKYEQACVAEPIDKRHRKRKESTGDAAFPGPQVKSGNKNSEREQRQQNASQRVVRNETVRVAHVDEITGHEESSPLTKLNRHHFEPPATPRQMRPPYADAEEAGNRGHSDPIG